MGGAETGEEAEGEVEAADQKFCREAHGADRDAEVGEEPEGSRGEGGSDASDQGLEFGLGEAVEEEVCDDQVVGVFKWDSESVGLVGMKASCGVRGCCFAALAFALSAFSFAFNCFFSCFSCCF